MFKLLNHQESVVDRIVSEVMFADASINTKLDVFAPTGSGKTYIATGIAMELSLTYILVSNISLIPQYEKVLQSANKSYCVIGDGRAFIPNTDVVIAMQQTLVSWYKSNKFKEQRSVDIVIIDEAHLANNENRQKLPLKLLNPLVTMKMTGTPYDKYCRYLSKDKNLIEVMSYKECLEKGITVPIKWIQSKLPWELKQRPDGIVEINQEEEAKIYGKYINRMVDEFLSIKEFDGKKNIWFCPNIQLANDIEKEFKKRDIPIYAYHSKSSDKDMIMNSFKNNKPIVHGDITYYNADKTPYTVRGLISVHGLSIGFSVDDIEVGVFVGTTLTRSTFIQRTSRTNRTSKGKEYATMLDFGKNFYIHGDIYDEFEPYDYDMDELDANLEYKKRRLKHYESLMKFTSNKPMDISREIHDNLVNALLDVKDISRSESLDVMRLRLSVSNDIMNSIVILIMALKFHFNEKELIKNNKGVYGEGYYAVGYNQETRKEVLKPVVNYETSFCIEKQTEKYLKAIELNPDRKEEIVDMFNVQCLNILHYKKSIWGLGFGADKAIDRLSLLNTENREEYTISKTTNFSTPPVIDIEDDEIPF